MTRLMIMTFFGEPRWKQLRSADGRDYHPHEAPPVMTVPMIILAVGSVGAGAFFAIDDRLANWLAPSVGPYEEPHPPFPAWIVTAGTLLVVAIGVFIAYWFIGRRPVPVTAPMPVPAIVTLARNDVGGNAVNETLFARPGIWLSRASVYADAKGVDGLVNGSAAALGGLSGRWRHWQNGYVRSYALSMFAGTLVVVLMLLLVRSA
jgi:NADH-quinone oxidoreductase subunit L